MTFATIAGFVLLGGLAVAVSYFLIVFFRRLLANGLPEPSGDSPYISVVDPPPPRIPRPEWVDWNEAKVTDNED